MTIMETASQKLIKVSAVSVVLAACIAAARWGGLGRDTPEGTQHLTLAH